MDKTKQREAFEAYWLKRTGFAPVRAKYHGGYYYTDQHAAWLSWQEALASIEISFVKIDKEQLVEWSVGKNYAAGYVAGRSNAIKTVKDAGLRVKS